MEFLIIILILIICLIWSIAFYAYKESILAKKKNKEDAFNLLKNRGTYDINGYDNIQYENLEITSKDGHKLKGYYINKYPKEDKVIILCHGYTANHYLTLQFIDMFLNEGFNVLQIDVRAHGDSEGKYPTYGVWEREDLDMWVDKIKSKVSKDAIIGIYGQSMGAATVLMYGGKYGEKIKFIIADCGYSNGKEILKYQFGKSKVPLAPIYPFLNLIFKIRCKFSMNDVSPIDDIKDCEVPTLFIHGTTDGTVPCCMSERMYEIKKGDKNELLIIKDAGHVVAYDKEKDTYEKAVHNFISKVLEEKHLNI
ncbi:MAG: alpha/beta hydrolase [Clostridium sp.]